MFVRRFAAALAVLALAPALASAAPLAQTHRAIRTNGTVAPAQPGQLAVGGFIGLESGDMDGFTLRLDGEYPLQPLTPKVGLSIIGSIGWFNSSDDIAFGDVSQNIFKFVPAARFTLPISPELSVYGDAGIGLYHARATIDQNVPGFGAIDDTETDTGLMLRFGAGGFYRLNEQLRLGAEIGFDPYLGDVDDTTFTIMAGVMYQL